MAAIKIAEYAFANRDGDVNIRGSDRMRQGQSFTTLNNGNYYSIDHCVFSLGNNGNTPSGNIVAELRTESHVTAYGTDSIGGSLLATSGAVNMNTITDASSTQQTTFTFSGANQYIVHPNTHYFINLYNNNGTDYVTMAYDGSSPTADGNRAYTDGTGTAWTADATRDICFEVWGNLVTAPTTTTLYPVSGVNFPVDGHITSANASYSGAHNASSGTSVTNTSITMYVSNSYFGGNYVIRRAGIVFDTSSIGTDTINSATLSLYDAADSSNTNNWKVDIVGVTPTSTSELAVGDFSKFGTTLLSDTEINVSSWGTEQYRDFPLNATGIASISGSGATSLGVRLSGDIANQTANADSDYVSFWSADHGVSGKIAKLVIDHTPSVASTTNASFLYLMV